MMARKPGSTNRRAGDQAALGPVQQPADVDGELLRLRARQQHAVVERVKESRLADPALLLDQDAVHHRDLPGGPAEARERRSAPTSGPPRRRRDRRPPPWPDDRARWWCSPFSRPLAVASCAFHPWRRGTNGRTRRRAPCRHRAGRDRRRTCATVPAMRRAAPGLPARDRGGPCPLHARSRPDAAAARWRVPTPRP